LTFAPFFSTRGVNALKNLKKLEHLRFFALTENESWRQKLECVILQQMPWMKTSTDKRGEPYHRLLELEGEFQLEVLRVESTLPPGATFPNLKKLAFRGLMRDHDSLDTLTLSPNINCFELEGSSHIQLISFLQLFGSTLNELTLDYMVDEIDLSEVFYYCPNLSKFDGFECKYFPDRSEFWSKLSIHNFRLLKDFFTFDVTTSSGPPGFLKFILEAPLIERIDMRRSWSECITFEVVQAAKDLTPDKLQNLHTFHIAFSEVDKIEFLAQLYKCVVCNAPRLSNFTLYMNKDTSDAWEERADIRFFEYLSAQKVV
jgi:hypothetical protein